METSHGVQLLMALREIFILAAVSSEGRGGQRRRGRHSVGGGNEFAALVNPLNLSQEALWERVINLLHEGHMGLSSVKDKLGASGIKNETPSIKGNT